MTNSGVTFAGKTVSVARHTWQAPWPVKQAAVIDGGVILVYDYMAGPADRQFQNLEAFSFSGERLWTAQHPGSDTADAYVEFLSLEPLCVWNFACFRCLIDPASGRLIKAEFTK